MGRRVCSLLNIVNIAIFARSPPFVIFACGCCFLPAAHFAVDLYATL